MKILIIKLGALGDVVRTLSILPAVKEKYPDSEIHWITKRNSLEIFENNPYLNKVYILGEEINEDFDILYNFDIEEEATKLAEEIKSIKKYGFYSEGGYAASFNLNSEYYLNTLFDDEIKRDNKKTYQEMMFEAAELPYKRELGEIYLTDKDKQYAEEFIQNNKIDTENLIGIHLGASSRWPSKVWAKEKVKEFIIQAKGKGYNIILFLGPNEISNHEKLCHDLKEEGIVVYRNNPHNSIKEFAALVNLCNKMICSDSFALHLSLALKKHTIGLFFCTPPNEVEGYNLLKKIISQDLYEFFPEKMDQYDEKLVNSIAIIDVLNALNTE